MSSIQVIDATLLRIHDYLAKTNVQLGASYSTSQKSSALYEKGYQAAASYINASRDDIGTIIGSFSGAFFQEKNL